MADPIPSKSLYKYTAQPYHKYNQALISDKIEENSLMSLSPFKCDK